MSTDSSNRRGMEVIRRLDAGERRLLLEAYDGHRASAPRGLRIIHWVNLYLNGAFTVEHPRRRELHAWVTRTVLEAYPDWPEIHVLAYGFITNPAGNPDGQPFHVDYTPTSSNLFVPLTRVSLLNAAQFIRQPLARARVDHKAEIGTIEDILESEGCDAIEVIQLVCRPFSLVRLLPGTPHRGIPNGGDDDRVMLFVTVDDHAYALAETAYFKYSSRAYESVPELGGSDE